MSKAKFKVGDAVKVFAPAGYSQFYIIGRITYVINPNEQPEYGIIYYSRYDRQILIKHAPEDRIISIEEPLIPQAEE